MEAAKWNRLEQEIRAILNRVSAESDSNTPDFVLADFLIRCLDAFNLNVRRRDAFYGIAPEPGSPHQIVRTFPRDS